MNRIINGIIFDTDKSGLIATIDNGLPIEDLSYFSESLYKTDDGKFFLHCKGQSKSHYHILDWDGKNSIGSEEIHPIEQVATAFWMLMHGIKNFYAVEKKYIETATVFSEALKKNFPDADFNKCAFKDLIFYIKILNIQKYN